MTIIAGQSASQENMGKAVEAYKSGASLKDSGRLCGYCPEGFRKVLRRLGVTVRNRLSAARRRCTLNHTYFDHIDTHEQAWLLGFIATDGNVQAEGYWRLSLGVKISDRDILHKIAGLLGSDAAVTVDRDSAVRVVFHSRVLVESLMSLGITPRKSFTVRPVPLPEHLAPSFWLGAIDGDGSIHRKPEGGYGVSFCGSLAMVSGFCDFLRKVTGGDYTPRPQMRIFQAHCNRTSHVRALLRAIYGKSSVCLDRKRLLAESELAREHRTKDWTWLTRERLEHLLSIHGDWRVVARELGTSQANLASIRSRLGMPMEQTKYAHLTLAAVETIYARLGSWRAVARELGMHPTNIARVLRRLRGERCVGQESHQEVAP